MASDTDPVLEPYQARIRAVNRRIERFACGFLISVLIFVISLLAVLATTGWDLDTRRTVAVGFSLSGTVIGAGTAWLSAREELR